METAEWLVPYLLDEANDAAGRSGEAIERAERGVRETVSERGPDDDLVAFVCERYERAGTAGDFATYVAALRADQKRKRKLMAILDRHGP
ncbi:hypothetical protein [Streptomyces sp. NPDC060031]|uniref:hypothetical protein n=1 Tax=Streptomyces sp. NPDC060031 TaxID=3347043 RepID=UPI0036C888B6